MELLTSRQALQEWRRGVGEDLAFVPTMGALHAGHLSLVEAAQQLPGRTIASIFVNPTQFGPQEDFARYPRTLEQDRELLQDAGCDALFVPSVADIYAGSGQTRVQVEPLGSDLCGQFRPTHFQGVATVVTVLLNLVRPDRLYLGQKDYQQLVVLRRLVEDLALPVQVIGVPTVRESDGLALSSRNRYLSEAERLQACAVSQALLAAQQARRSGERQVAALQAVAHAVLQRYGVEKIDYIAVRDAETLLELPEGVVGAEDPVMLLAVRVGVTRLIDNLLLAL
ncbi:pantoate--beta-alanine ligase [Candidatus Magnetaquicoccus inordinatus]|uniref:pantoate--beta-alanine ligase n=1 Tax=Candidatus Magnetaquicoccus inordinatus TaxID=2496818 RepID=UPI00102AC540|nr:pantoate--beta-alanine ligase [Candidatus Magnetaquicoccus inordinatus]